MVDPLRRAQEVTRIAGFRQGPFGWSAKLLTMRKTPAAAEAAAFVCEASKLLEQLCG
jgi:hypothetical protein